MCNCKHSTAIVGEDGHGKCQINSWVTSYYNIGFYLKLVFVGNFDVLNGFSRNRSISVGEGWESGYGEYDDVLDESYRRPETSFRSDRSFRTPTRGIATVVPKETLQGSIADTPELAEGVAIVRRRLNCKICLSYLLQSIITLPVFLFKYYLHRNTTNVPPFSRRYSSTLHNSTRIFLIVF